jgi:hypothetical protein
MSRPTRFVTGRRSILVGLLLAVTCVMAAPVAQAAPKPKAAKAFDTVVPLKIGDLFLRDGQLIALVKLGKTEVEVPIDLTTLPGADCPILDLALGPIHLDLLGLVVDTSPICLAITADPGAGNLLGNLLCGVAHLLDDGLPLDLILGGLVAEDVDAVLDGLTDLLNGVLRLATAPAALEDAACDILNLSLGPVELNLLGLVVELDDCAGGPVTVDITAEPGEGNLLGNLLCGLAGLLDGGGTDAAIAAALQDIAGAIRALL